MKTKLLIVALTLLGINAMAQSTQKINNVIFKTADGKVIPADKLDSVKKALGGNIVYQHTVNEPNVMYLIAKGAAAQKEESESKAKFLAMIGKPAPDFNLKSIDGKKYNLAALKGKVIVFNFWFIACSGCVAEMPELNRLKARYKANDVVFLALALDRADQIRAFQKTHDFGYAIIPSTRQTHKDYGVYACPVSMVIDRDGRVSSIIEAGRPINNTLPAAINTALK